MVDSRSLGWAGGFVWGGVVFFSLLSNHFFSYAPLFSEMIRQIYPGIGTGLWGSFLGLLLGFADGFILLFLIGWIYNTLSNKKA